MMKLHVSLVVALSCAVLAGAANAQDLNDPNAGGGLSVVSGPGAVVDESASYDDGYDPTAYALFEADLSPFGEWFDDAQYGRVWSPSPAIVGTDFAPYATAGRWSLTQYGWTWLSDYPWGWAPFHYGRWVTIAPRGWAWVPGTVWGPAWVSWRTGQGYAGWAPLPPAGLSIAEPTYSGSWWRFVPVQQLGMPRPGYLPWSTVATLYPRTSYYNPARTMTFNQRVVRYNPGPMGLAAPSAMPVAPLQRNAFPRATIAPRAAMPIGARPWMGRPSGYAQPGYAQPNYGQPMYRPAQPNYGQPMYRPAQPNYGQPMARPAQPGYAQPNYGQPMVRPAQPVYQASKYEESEPR